MNEESWWWDVAISLWCAVRAFLALVGFMFICAWVGFTFGDVGKPQQTATAQRSDRCINSACDVLCRVNPTFRRHAGECVK